MEIKVKLLSRGALVKTVSLPDGSTCEDLLDLLDIDPQTVIIIRSGTPIPLDETLREGEAIEIMRIVSGGRG